MASTDTATLATSPSGNGTGSQPDAKPPRPTISFPISPVGPNPLGQGNHVRTAAILVIGDEILNGKTQDTNSHNFARYCFELGIELKRIEVVADVEEEIVEASRRMVKLYDFVITTGGIGPTHDDITYDSIAKAFNLPLKHDPETLKRMEAFTKARPPRDLKDQTEEQRVARERMALFPFDERIEGGKVEIIFTADDMWVPVVRLAGRLCIFPGIPSLFLKMLNGLTPYIPLPPPEERPFRHQIHTLMRESNIAPFLTDLQARVKDEGIRIGSYPQLTRGVYVSLIGPDERRVREIGEEVIQELQGAVVEMPQARAVKSEKSSL